MKKFQVLLGLMVMMLVLWTVATPVNADDKSLLGAGWDPYAGCSCCDDIDWMDCESGNVFYCAPGSFVGLIWGPDYDLEGSPNGGEACRGAGGAAPCYNFFHSTLSCD